MSNLRSCPDCGRKLVFAPDGRGLLCEHCGFKKVVTRQLPLAKELGQAQKFLGTTTPVDPARETGLRLSLRQGRGAVKEKNLNEAFFHLERVILAANAPEKMRAEAWLWLSEVYDDAGNKRECLEQALALDPINGAARRQLAILDGRLRQEEVIDPDQIHQTISPEPQTAQAAQFTCPNCASRMNFAPDGQSLRCEFCGYEQSLMQAEEVNVKAEFGFGELEQDFAVGLARVSGHVQPLAMRLLQCHGCGIEFVLAPMALSITCPYCDHVYVTEAAETHEVLPPQALIPFITMEADVRGNLRLWFQQQKISRVRLSPIIGIYQPVWTFDLSGEIGWKGLVRRGDNWVNASGSDHVLLDDHLVLAQEKPAPMLRQLLESFDLTHLVAYDERFLADWPAQRYQLSLADASLLARRAVMQQIRRDPYRLTGGQEVRDLTLNSSGLVIMSYKLILLPVWVVHYEYETKGYDLFINGQNGIIYGEKPGGFLGKIAAWVRNQ